MITKMQSKYAHRPEMAWVEGDVMALPFADASFDLVIDKATMDSFMTAVRDPWVSPSIIRARRLDPEESVVDTCEWCALRRTLNRKWWRT